MLSSKLQAGGLGPASHALMSQRVLPRCILTITCKTTFVVQLQNHPWLLPVLANPLAPRPWPRLGLSMTMHNMTRGAGGAIAEQHRDSAVEAGQVRSRGAGAPAAGRGGRWWPLPLAACAMAWAAPVLPCTPACTAVPSRPISKTSACLHPMSWSAAPPSPCQLPCAPHHPPSCRMDVCTHACCTACVRRRRRTATPWPSSSASWVPTTTPPASRSTTWAGR